MQSIVNLCLMHLVESQSPPIKPFSSQVEAQSREYQPPSPEHQQLSEDSSTGKEVICM